METRTPLRIRAIYWIFRELIPTDSAAFLFSPKLSLHFCCFLIVGVYLPFYVLFSVLNVLINLFEVASPRVFVDVVYRSAVNDVEYLFAHFTCFICFIVISLSATLLFVLP